MLTGENGIIKQTQNSKEQTEIGEEKEYINLAVSAIKMNKITNEDTSRITKEELQTELAKYTDEATVSEDGTLVVTYTSKRSYTVDGKGKIEEVGESYDGIYSVPGLEGKIAPTELFEYEIISNAETGATKYTSLPTKEAKIVRIKPEYCNSRGYNPTDNSFSFTDTNYEIKYNDITDTLVIPYQVEINGEKYKITEVSLLVLSGVNSDSFKALPCIENIIYPNTVTKICCDGYFAAGGFYNKKLKKIVLPNKITSIPRAFFSECVNIENINIPDNVTTIGDNAFWTCTGLTSITIPNSVTDIGNNAFKGCSSLTDVYYTGTEEQWNEIIIESGNTMLTNATINYNYKGE